MDINENYVSLVTVIFSYRKTFFCSKQSNYNFLGHTCTLFSSVDVPVVCTNTC